MKKSFFFCTDWIALQWSKTFNRDEDRCVCVWEQLTGKGEASTCCRHKSLYIRPNTTLLCKIQMRICVQTETNTQLTIFKKGGEIRREQWRIRKLSIVQINLHKHCISIDFSIHICTEPHQQILVEPNLIRI